MVKIWYKFLIFTLLNSFILGDAECKGCDNIQSLKERCSASPHRFFLQMQTLIEFPERIEIWREIPSYPGYMVSNNNQVKSLRFGHHDKEGILKLNINKDGYLALVIYKNKKKVSIRVHKLVALAFHPNPDNKPAINHKNGIKTDNRPENIEWCTVSENTLHSYRVLGKNYRLNEKHPLSRPVYQYSIEGNLIAEWPCAFEIARKLGFRSCNIGLVCRGIRKKAHGYFWSFHKINI